MIIPSKKAVLYLWLALPSIFSYRDDIKNKSGKTKIASRIQAVFNMEGNSFRFTSVAFQNNFLKININRLVLKNTLESNFLNFSETFLPDLRLYPRYYYSPSTSIAVTVLASLKIDNDGKIYTYN